MRSIRQKQWIPILCCLLFVFQFLYAFTPVAYAASYKLGSVEGSPRHLLRGFEEKIFEEAVGNGIIFSKQRWNYRPQRIDPNTHETKSDWGVGDFLVRIKESKNSKDYDDLYMHAAYPDRGKHNENEETVAYIKQMERILSANESRGYYIEQVFLYSNFSVYPVFSDTGEVTIPKKGDPSYKEHKTTVASLNANNNSNHWTSPISLKKREDGTFVIDLMGETSIVRAGGGERTTVTNNAESRTDTTLGADTGEESRGLLEQAVDKIMECVLSPISTVLGLLLTSMVDSLLVDFQINPGKNFLPLLASVTDQADLSNNHAFVMAFLIVGMAFLLFDMLIGLFLCMTKEDNNGDSPVRIMIRGMLAAVAIVLCYSFLSKINTAIFGTDVDGTGAFLGCFLPGGKIYRPSPDDLAFMKSIDAAFMVTGLPKLILQLILNLVLVFTVFRLFLEVIERWILLNLMYLTAPMALAMAPSSSTSGITRKYLASYLSQAMIMLFNVWIVEAAMIMLRNLGKGKDTYREMTGWNGFVASFVIIGMLLAATKVDQYLRDMGLAAVRTGQGLAMAVVGSIHTVTSMGKTLVRSSTSQGIYANAMGLMGVRNLAGEATGFGLMERLSASGRLVNAQGNKKTGNEHLSYPMQGKRDDAYKKEALLAHGERKIQEPFLGTHAANYMATNFGSKANFLLYDDRMQDATWYNPNKETGYATVGFTNDNGNMIVMAGSIDTKNTSGAIDLGNGHFLHADSGEGYIGGDLSEGLDAERPISLAEYNDRHYGAFGTNTMEQLGLTLPEDAYTVKAVEDGGIVIGHGGIPDAYLSYQKNAYQNQALSYLDSDGKPQSIEINGNPVYGLSSFGEEDAFPRDGEDLHAFAKSYANDLNLYTENPGWRASLEHGRVYLSQDGERKYEVTSVCEKPKHEGRIIESGYRKAYLKKIRERRR